MENNWKNNPKISVKFYYFKEKEICPAYTSKINSKWLILKTTNSINDSNEEKEGWNNPAVKKLSTLLRGITSKHHGNFYYFICLHSFRTEIKLKSHAKICKNKDFLWNCNAIRKG